VRHDTADKPSFPVKLRVCRSNYSALHHRVIEAKKVLYEAELELSVMKDVVNELEERRCRTCGGSAQISEGDELRVRMIPCPSCHGTGERAERGAQR
jgi:Zn finger protein HypA/HybF involved in hydrogenase expression